MKTRTLQKKKLLLVFGFIVLFSATLIYCVLLFHLASRSTESSLLRSDAVLILGTASYKDCRINPCLVTRVEKGIEVYNKGTADVLIFSGGNETGPPFANEAETMEKIARDRYILPESIELEKRATSTYENVLFTKELMMERDLQSVILITEGFHMPRAVATAKKVFGNDISFGYVPVLESECWQQDDILNWHMLREPVAYISYFLTGKL